MDTMGVLDIYLCSYDVDMYVYCVHSGVWIAGHVQYQAQ